MSKKIAHLSDIHIKFASRHEEYRDVFKSLYGDLKKQKPERIVITGDLNHVKINMSPGSVDLATELLTELVKICPVDIILGNHDINLQQKSLGDTITPIINTANRFLELSSPKEGKKAFVVSKNNYKNIDFTKKGIYFYPDSGFYKISDELVYGVYSCKDNEILSLNKKEEGVKYIALFHGQIKGARGDNGYELMSDGLINLSAFQNFDIVMLGDIHEHQSFERIENIIVNDYELENFKKNGWEFISKTEEGNLIKKVTESAAYASSLIQQDYGESIDKGYLIWDLETKTFERRIIPNDYGFAKISIAQGELFEERVDNISFSNDKRKTKVYIEWQDFEENYSIEKESQIAKYIKQKFGCEVVKVDFVEIKKAISDNNDVKDSINKETYIEQIRSYLADTSPNEEEEIIDDVINLAKNIDKILEIPDKIEPIRTWDVDRVEISNIFSFPETPIIIDFEKLRGSTGIFGRNFSGKSNVVRAIVWGLYQYIIGGGNAKKLINLYTSSNKGYVKINLTINGEKYCIKREVVTKTDKHGESSNTYPIEFKKLEINENGKEIWVDEASEKKANDKKVIKEIIYDAIGTVDDFTKVCLQTQGGKEDYINQGQQPKNDLINKYLGLEPFRDRYDYANKEFNEIKRKQKDLGDIVSLQEKQVNINTKIQELEEEYNRLAKDKLDSETKKEEIDNKIVELSKSLKQKVVFSINEIDDMEKLLKDDVFYKNQVEETEKSIKLLTDWLSLNFKKELPFNESETIENLQFQLDSENKNFFNEKNKYIEIENWLKQNEKRKLFNIVGFDTKIQQISVNIANLQAKLPIYKGQSCPTCGHVKTQPNIELYNKCEADIRSLMEEKRSYENAITKYNDDLKFNNSRELKESTLMTLRQTLTNIKSKKDLLNQRISLISQSQDMINHNKLVEQTSKRLEEERKNLENKKILIERIKLNIEKINTNLQVKKHNLSIENDIYDLQEQSRSYKISIYGVGQQITEKNGDLRILKKDLEDIRKKIDEVIIAEKEFKKYSLFLQAVYRDGIPARIIRRKIPIINNKINSILGTIVNFKIEMSVLTNGDVVEGFYFSNDKSDMLPLSFASGSQKFISSVVIKDALHYMSNLMKPSINIIDEGFGTLDDELISGIILVLQYLKNKYKNVLIITHRNEIKDSVNNMIEVYKTTDGIPKEILDANEHACITQINIS